MSLLNKIDHIGIAVTNLAEAIDRYRRMGFELIGRETVADQMVETAFFRIGESTIELLAATDPASPIAKFIEKNGNRGGMAHMAINVTGLEEKLAELEKQGFQLIDAKPKIGAHGAKIAFVHPRSTSGVLLELCEKPSED